MLKIEKHVIRMAIMLGVVLRVGYAADIEAQFQSELENHRARVVEERKKIETQFANCKLCKGSGVATRKMTCETCGGGGVLMEKKGSFSVGKPCVKCNGKGSHLQSNICSKCAHMKRRQNVRNHNLHRRRLSGINRSVISVKGKAE